MILEGVAWVVERSRHVTIDERRLAEVCAQLDPAQLRLPDWRIPIAPAWRDERLVDWILLFSSINFSYWGEPKWTVVFHGEPYDGAFGMMAALTRALEEGRPVLDGAFLAGVDGEQFRSLLRGSTPIPMQAERLAIWHEVSPVLVRDYGGRWHDVVRQADGSAVRLVELLVGSFPSFDDAAWMDGRRIPFYKRAQLAAGMLGQAYGLQGWGAFQDFDQLTVYSDYKLPQVLRKMGILAYDAGLMSLVDTRTQLPAGGQLEVEIRGATVWAGELMRRALAPRAPGLTASHVDYWLWETGQTKSPGDLPYHRTRTTAY